MSKGDRMTVWVDGFEHSVVADKAGRTVDVGYKPKNKETWIVVNVLTRTGKQTGIRFSAPLRLVQGFDEYAPPPDRRTRSVTGKR